MGAPSEPSHSSRWCEHRHPADTHELLQTQSRCRGKRSHTGPPTRRLPCVACGFQCAECNEVARGKACLSVVSGQRSVVSCELSVASCQFTFTSSPGIWILRLLVGWLL